MATPKLAALLGWQPCPAHKHETELTSWLLPQLLFLTCGNAVYTCRAEIYSDQNGIAGAGQDLHSPNRCLEFKGREAVSLAVLMSRKANVAPGYPGLRTTANQAGTEVRPC